MAEDLTAELAELRAEVRQLRDFEEIRRLLDDYIYYLDRGMWPEYASLYAENGQMRLGPARADGRADIERVARDTFARGEGPFETVSGVHIVSSPRIDLHGDSATSEVMWTVVARDSEGKVAVTLNGRHADDLVRENGQWRFQKRRGFMDIAPA
jgi:hypothetical protein